MYKVFIIFLISFFIVFFIRFVLILININTNYIYSCNYTKIEKIKGFQSSNFTKHYLHKHPNIAYNKKSEIKRKRSKF